MIVFDPEKTFVRTTDYNRTISSAKCFLKGLFSENNITINNVPRKSDYVSISNYTFNVKNTKKYSYLSQTFQKIFKILLKNFSLKHALYLKDYIKLDFTWVY